MARSAITQDEWRSLREDYNRNLRAARDLCDQLPKQLAELLDRENAALGVPLEFRVKDWQKIADKLESRGLKLRGIKDLQDLVGIRIILLFLRDVRIVCSLIEANFNVIKKYDTQDRLSNDQFGYSSVHYVVKLKRDWLSVPTFALMADFKIEIQVRTLAQHVWAASSHKLQYKEEASVPEAVRRSLSRLAAILEGVDQELERVLEARDAYIHSIADASDQDLLNVDLIENILDSELPEDNKTSPEDFDQLLRDLDYFDIRTNREFREFVKKYKTEALKQDLESVRRIMLDIEHINIPGDPGLERLRKGVFLTHSGLVRAMLKVHDPLRSEMLKKLQYRQRFGHEM